MPFPLTHDDPQTLGAHRLVARLGGGGMGTVYLARSAGGRTVALKTVHPRYAADEAFRTRFRLEADAARVIGGRYGAAVVDADPFAPVPWLATEYVLGPPLDEAVGLCGPLPERTVRALGTVLARALGQLHGSDVVHRDLKPSNVLVTTTGPKLIDFGIARAVGDDRLTRTGTAAGTPAFMSPEQAAGGEHTSAGDVFALAGVLLFAATGHGPFGGGQAADLLYRVRYAEPDLSGAPEALAPLLARCLDKDPNRRPGTAELTGLLAGEEDEDAFADALPAALLADIAARATEVWRVRPHRLPVPQEFADASTAPAARPSSGPSRRKLLALGGGSALALAAAGGGAWARWGGRGGDDGPKPKSKPAGRSRPSGVPSKAVWWAEVEHSDAGCPPVPLDGLIAVKGSKGITAFEAKTGTKRWTTRILQSHEFTTDGKRIYTYAPDGIDSMGLRIFGVRPEDGGLDALTEKLHDFSSAFTGAEPLAARNGVIYVVARKGNERDKSPWHFLALDLRTGKERWRKEFKAGYVPGSSTFGFTGAVFGDHLVYTGQVPLEPMNFLKSRRITNGENEWEWTFPRQRSDVSTALRDGELATDGRRVYYGITELVAVTVADGKEAWRFGPGRDKGRGVPKGARSYGRPVFGDGVVYVVEGTRGIVALAADTGKLLWETAFPDLPPGLTMPPVVGRAHLYVHATDGAHDAVVAIDLRSHRIAWRMDVPGRVDAPLTAHPRAGTLVWTSGDLVCAIPLT
ncbi:PQQ-binding-like beta-propeller repeat protein [Streptomyces sp. AV19]|uniref:serine/threonine-protein kinase n=1 Tax=Streptomyces sp. AV19 TaxID=2793068 RepID=UPI0018FF08F8|nr:PQQ-binding-like beta-propeller repeat protein [Streptomyces sp. AV19]MBH1934064.1 PQQ-binding-like beta-propeller repeat protein [Streptomyces sp. AV19]MDG4535455.1 PQQ-binding-like beta-propeller repeat protein [Streptomyces sp. AV19]